MTVESRAVRAARSIQMSVTAVQPAGVGVINRRHRAGWAVAVAFIGMMAGVSVAVASMLPTAADDDTAGPPTTVTPVTTTIPSEPAPPIIIPPVDDGEDDGDQVETIAAADPYEGIDDPSALGDGWDQFGFGVDTTEWPTTTTTEPEETTTTTTTIATTTTTKPSYTGVTANQYYGPVTAKPYEKIYGTAPPGTKVKLTSEYGSSQMTVDNSGEYYLKIYFSGQPSGKYFPITATIGSKVFTFQFKWTGSYEVTASQYYGPEHDQKYDKVYGTAPPGTIVTTTSDYGSSEMTVDSSSSYYLKIYFNETLPANQQITWTATLKDPGGTVLLAKTFNFTWEPVYTVTAKQGWGPEYDQPREKITGTAGPNSDVSATSPYGSASTTVDGAGEFRLVISFTDPPPNESFFIRVSVAGQLFRFSFTYLGA